MGKLAGVVIDGTAATWATTLPHLITIWRKEGFYRRAVWLCRCDHGPCDEVPATDDGPADLPGGEWSVCPYGILRGLQFRALVNLHECAKISPLSGWPESFPAWLTWGLATLRARLEGGK